MKITKHFICPILIVMTWTACVVAAPYLDPAVHGEKTEKINVLIASGRWSVEHDNAGRTFRMHNELLTTVLEATGRFRVRVMEDFRGIGPEVLSRYDVVIMAREGRDAYYDATSGGVVKAEGLGDITDRALIKFVKEKGGGIVWFHSSGIQEDDWGFPEAFNEIRGAKMSDEIGLRRIPRSDVIVRVAAPRHPITEGIESSWYVVNDDILAGTKIYPGTKVLLEVYEDLDWYPDNWNPEMPTNIPPEGSSGLYGMNDYNPLAWINEYGAGRSFTITLGHGLDTFRRLPFIVMLARGVEWAATGEVTIAPPDLSGDNRLIQWPYYQSDPRHNARWD